MPRREPLTSRTSPQVTAVRALHTARGRSEAGLFVVEGPQGVREALASAARIDTLFVTPDAASRWTDLVDAARDREAAVLGAVETVIEAMSETATPQGILAVCEVPHRSIDDVLAATGPVVLLDEVSDPGNAGTIIRTADAVGAAGVVITPGGVDPYNGKCVRATAGSIFHLPVVTGLAAAFAVAALRAEGITIVAATGDGTADLLDWAPSAPGRLCWAFGSEAHGVGAEVRGLADALVRIPMPGRAESLNVASAAAVCLYADLARAHGRIEDSPTRTHPTRNEAR